MPRNSSRSMKGYRKRRNGFSVRALLIGLVLFAGVGGLVWYTFPNISFSSQETGPMLHVVSVSDFVHDITERGNVESASNVDIRCEVESRGSSGTMILWLIPEGAVVEPGQELCKLDSSSLEQELVQQQIICNTSQAQVIQAKNDFETAEIALEEYLEGVYEEENQRLLGAVFVAEENLRRAEQTLAYTEKLFARGYVTELAVEADQFSVLDARKKLEQAETELEVLEKYTKRKTVKQLEADIATKKAKFESEEHSHKLDKEKLAEVEMQVEKCTIVAPDSGQVVYANVTDRRGGREVIIEEGESVRERQVIFRLPDPKRMQVKAAINEASIAMVEVGMPASIRLDAFPEKEFRGEVEKVNEYPNPTSFFSGNVKEYETTVRILLPENKAGTSGSTNAPNGTDEDGASEAQEDASTAQDAGDTEDEEVASSDGDETGSEDEGKQEEENGSEGESSDEAVTPMRGDLRPGMTAEVKIRVETLPSVVHIPVQAIIEHGGKNYCLMLDKATRTWSKREVKIGSTNDKTVVIEEGLEEGEAVVLGAVTYRSKVDWPDLPDTPEISGEEQAAARQPANRQPGGEGRPNPAQMFKQLDKNGDGKLSSDEAPGPMKSNFSSADKNGDGSVDRSEFMSAMAAAGRRPGQGGPGQGGSGQGRPAGAGGGPGGSGGPGGGARGGSGGAGQGGSGPRPGGAR